MKAVLLVDASGEVASWEHDALRLAVDEGLEIVCVARCLDHSSPPRKARYAAYYAMALTGRWRMPELKRRSIADLTAANAPVVTFHSEWEGMWQRIPREVSDKFKGADVVLRFGMNLLRGPDELPVPLGVLSYHHGDPTRYRGRPAGYYELKAGEPVQGVIVQRLSDTLDGGRVLASSFAQVIPYSYAKTRRSALRAGVPLLSQALRDLTPDIGHKPPTLGPNYRLPDNDAALRLMWTLGARKVRRGWYGLAKEKQWQVALAELPDRLDTDVVLETQRLRPIEAPSGYTFTADPSPLDASSVFVEIMNARTGKGEIALWRSGRWVHIDLGLAGRHTSYPQVVSDGSRRYLFPEIAESSSPALFELSADVAKVLHRHDLKGLEGLRLVDATLFHSDEGWFVFAGVAGTAATELRLWSASTLMGPYTEHPASPVCTDPRGARMAGPLAAHGGKLLRFGQDGTINYGGSIRVHEVLSLTRDQYSEGICGAIRCADAWGPHTFAVTGDHVWVDYYRERTTILAGVRRVLARIRG